MMNSNKSLLRLSILIALMAFAMLGCVKMGGGSSSNLPWSQPAEWENQTLGIPL